MWDLMCRARTRGEWQKTCQGRSGDGTVPVVLGAEAEETKCVMQGDDIVVEFGVQVDC